MKQVIKQFFNWYFQKKALPYWSILLIDCVIVIGSGFLTYIVGHSLPDYFDKFVSISTTLGFYLIFFVIGFLLMRTYKGILRFSSFVDIKRIGAANCIGLVLAYIARAIFHTNNFMEPLSTAEFFLIFVLATCLMVALRVVVKGIYDFQSQSDTAENAFIYGVKAGGIAIAKTLRVTTPQRFILKGFISDDPSSTGHELQGVKIFYNDESLLEHMRKANVTVLLVSPMKYDRFVANEKMVNDMLNAGIQIFTGQTAQEWDPNAAEVEPIQIREIQIEDLLHREQIQVNLDDIQKQLCGKRVMISGSAGSIGSEIVRQVAQFKPAQLILLDAAETPQHDIRLMMQKEFPDVPCETIVTSISYRVHLEEIFKMLKPEYVFHAAAYKHVPMMEDNPTMAVFNNIMGTKFMADLSVKYGVKKFVMISTDKAVNPTNVMGCSKRICEIYVQSLDKHLKEIHAENATQFVTTRFGNVLGSNGSVVPLFKEQIKNGGPITVTHPDIIRFFMLIPEACKLVLEAGTMGKGGEIFVFDMGDPVKIADLARRMIQLSGAKNIEIKYTGLRDGEKLYEEVLNDQEKTLPTFNKKIKIAQVREYNFEEVSKQIDELASLSLHIDDMKIVGKMKEMVPEFKSQHSKYEALDK